MSKLASLLTAGAIVASALMLSGCSSAVPTNSYIPPGASLGKTVVDPPAKLPPAPTKAPEVTNPANDYSKCHVLTDVAPITIGNINHPLSSIVIKDPSLTGARVTSAQEMAVDSNYPKAFNFLIKATLDNGGTVWFGSKGDVNNVDIQAAIQLDSNRDEPIFGANADAYKYFVWGSQVGPTGAIVQSSTAAIAEYGFCFTPKAG